MLARLLLIVLLATPAAAKDGYPYVLSRNYSLSDDFKADPSRACARAYDALGPGRMDPPVVRKRQ